MRSSSLNGLNLSAQRSKKCCAPLPFQSGRNWRKSSKVMVNTDLHRAQPVFTTGLKPENASAAMILVHGRGASANDILTLAQEFDQTRIAFVAPQAANGTWYPQRFIA